jgi:hypothetical protein
VAAVTAAAVSPTVTTAAIMAAAVVGTAVPTVMMVMMMPMVVGKIPVRASKEGEAAKVATAPPPAAPADSQGHPDEMNDQGDAQEKYP